MPTAVPRALDTPQALAAIVEASDDAIVGKTLDGIVTSWNRAAERLYGWTASEIVGQSIVRIVPPERTAELTTIYSRLRRGDRVDHFETVRIDKNGHLLDVSVSIAPIADASGTVVGAAAITRDITQCKRTERNQRVLAEAGRLLVSSLDLASTLGSLARIAIPTLADFCTVHMVEPDGQLRLAAVAHIDPQKEELLWELGNCIPWDPARQEFGADWDPRTERQAVLLTIDAEPADASGPSILRTQVFRPDLGGHSSICVPLVARHRTLGVVTLTLFAPERSFGPAELDLAQELIRRAALAIDNARLYQEAEAAETRIRGLFEGVADAILVSDSERSYVDVNRATEDLLGYDRAELLGRRVDDITVAEPGSTPEEYAGSPGKGRWQRELSLQRKDGSTVPVEIRETTVDLPDGPVHLAAVRDISERVTAFGLLEQRLGTLSAIARSLAVSQTLETTLNALTAEVVRVTPAVACSVKLIDEERGRVETIATCGLPEGYAEAVEAAYQAGAKLISIEAHRAGRPLLRSLRRDVLPDPLHAPLHSFLVGTSWDAILTVPVVYGDRALGTLTGSYPMGYEPDQEEVAFFLTIADQVAVAVENARLFAEAQGKAVLEERQRLARELHDSVSQAIYGVTLYTKAASRLLASGESLTAAMYIDEISTIAREALQEMRLLIFELRPPLLEQEGLVAALQSRLEAVESRAGIETTLEAYGIGRLSAAVEHALYRVGQEALTNALKHAKANSVTITLRRHQGTLTMIIADDGIGFSPTAAAGCTGLGLVGMKERAAEVGGQLRIDSAPGKGTRVLVEVKG